MFNDPEFNPEDSPHYRTSYSAETGKVVIYFMFPSIKHYLGDDCRFKKTLPAQILIADLVAERCFLEIAKKKVENRGITIRPEGLQDRILRDAADLSRRFGKKIHEALVDQALLNGARDILENSRT